MKVFPVRNSFNTGEISELCDFRDDLAKYGGACKVLENAFPLVEGGAAKMPGTFYAGSSKFAGSKCRLVSFSRSSNFGDYMLEFGNLYIRFWTVGSTPGLILGSNNLPYEVTTTYAEADLFNLDINTQSADVLYIFHHLYPPMTLNHYADANWTLSNLGATGSLDESTSESGIPKVITGISNANPPVVTAINHGFVTGDIIFLNHIVGMVELNYLQFAVTVSGNTEDWNPSSAYSLTQNVSVGCYANITFANNYQNLYVAIAYNGSGSVITLPTVTVQSNSGDTLVVSYASHVLSISLANTTSSKNAANLIQSAINAITNTDYTFSQWTVTENVAYAANRPTSGVSLISQEMVTNNEYYQCIFVCAASATNTNHFPPAESTYWKAGTPVGDPANQFTLVGVDTTDYTAYESGGVAIQVLPLFGTTGNYPSCGALYQQRLCVGGSDNNPSQFSGSVVGDYANFISDPEEDDYAVIFTLVSQKVDQILNMVASPNALLLGTASGPWTVTGSNGGPITATSVQADKQATIGVGNLAPQQLNDSVIFVSNSLRTVMFLVYNFVSNQWDNFDLTRLNRNITIGTSAATSGIAQTAFQAEPYPVFWAVRNDGQLIGLVFNKQDQVFAWFRINMIPEGGTIESVAVISQAGSEDQIWISVARTINGGVVRYIEYFSPFELFGQLSNAMFVHCGIQATFSGVVSDPVLYADGSPVLYADGSPVLYSNSSYTGNPGAVNTITGLQYLAGQTVVAVGDGSKLSVNGQSSFVVPSSGQLTFDTYANQITVGIPYHQIIKPTQLVVASQGGSSRGMKQKLRRVTLSIYQGIGGMCGTENGYMYQIPYGESYLGGPPAMFTGEVTVDIDCDWDAHSNLIIQNDAPFPFTLRGLVARLEFNPD